MELALSTAAWADSEINKLVNSAHTRSPILEEFFEFFVAMISILY